jgi:hypothetical protein
MKSRPIWVKKMVGLPNYIRARKGLWCSLATLRHSAPLSEESEERGFNPQYTLLSVAEMAQRADAAMLSLDYDSLSSPWVSPCFHCLSKPFSLPLLQWVFPLPHPVFPAECGLLFPFLPFGIHLHASTAFSPRTPNCCALLEHRYTFPTDNRPPFASLFAREINIATFF